VPVVQVESTLTAVAVQTQVVAIELRPAP